MATGVAYNMFKKLLLDGSIDFANDTFKMILLPDTHTPDIDADEYYDDVSGDELTTAGGYTAGGATLAGKAVTVDDTDDEGVFDCTDISWTADGTGFTCRYAILYKDTGDPATSPLIAYWDFGVNQNPVSMTFSLVVNVEGLINIE